MVGKRFFRTKENIRNRYKDISRYLHKKVSLAYLFQFDEPYYFLS